MPATHNQRGCLTLSLACAWRRRAQGRLRHLLDYSVIGLSMTRSRTALPLSQAVHLSDRRMGRDATPRGRCNLTRLFAPCYCAIEGKKRVCNLIVGGSSRLRVGRTLFVGPCAWSLSVSIIWSLICSLPSLYLLLFNRIFAF